jgi:hypothetical protein
MVLEGIPPLELWYLLADRYLHDLPLRRCFATSRGLIYQIHEDMGSSARFPSLPNSSLQNNLEYK